MTDAVRGVAWETPCMPEMNEGPGTGSAELPAELRAVVQEEGAEENLLPRLWAAALSAEEWDRALEEAGAIGHRAGQAGASPDQVARRVLRCGRALERESTRRRLLDDAQARRMGEVVDEATLRATAACAEARADRREAWLSFLAHEIKNPLNTVLNALWLLREQREGTGRERFFELAERAVRRIEDRVVEVRDLDRLCRTEPSTPDHRASGVDGKEPPRHL